MDSTTARDDYEFLNAFPALAQSHLTAIKSASTPISANLASIPSLPSLPQTGLGTNQALSHIQSTIVPNLAQGHAGPRYFGFVTGGVTPAALYADYLVSTYDQNVQVHLPQSISTHVERHTIGMLCELLELPGFDGTLTTGATGGNILGLACGREWTCSKLTGRRFSDAGNGKVRVLVAGGHSSIGKACSILGIGRKNCIDLTSKHSSPNFGTTALIRATAWRKEEGVPFIIVATFGEVNTGDFTGDIAMLRRTCDEFGGWLHIDAAFGVLARIHPDYRGLAEGLELADSIAFDGHKFFNVPYDCGVFLTKHKETLSGVCGNTGAAYLAAGDGEEVSPLNLSLENSRRFRALPLYASLLSLGRNGYMDIVSRCCALAKALGKKIKRSAKFVLLYEVVFNIVLFQANGHESVEANEKIKDATNGTGKVYISGTKWKGQGALRIAICNHLIPSNAEEEASEILEILESVVPT